MFSITLNKAGIVCSNSKVFAGTDSVVELAKTSDIPAQYVHPQEKQCNYSYTHPAEKQCNYEPDLTNYVTKEEMESAGGAKFVIGNATIDSYNEFTISFSSAFNVVWLCAVNDIMRDERYIYQPIMITSEEVSTSKDVEFYGTYGEQFRLLRDVSLTSTRITATIDTEGLGNNIDEIRYVAWLQ